MIVVYFALGFLCGVLWSVLRWTTLTWIDSSTVQLVIISASEEALRFIALSWLIRSVPPSSIWVGAAFGAGFGVREAVVRRLDLVNYGELQPIDVIGPFVPLTLHVVLSMMLWRFLALHRGWLGFALCSLIHAGYNLYVWLFAQQLSPSNLWWDTLSRLFLLCALALYLFWQGSRTKRDN